MVNDLSNEIVNISEDIGKAKVGNMIYVDSKKTKRKLKKLEMHANDILTKVNEIELISDQKRSTSNTRVNNFLEEPVSKGWNAQPNMGYRDESRETKSSSIVKPDSHVVSILSTLKASSTHGMTSLSNNSNH